MGCVGESSSGGGEGFSGSDHGIQIVQSSRRLNTTIYNSYIFSDGIRNLSVSCDMVIFVMKIQKLMHVGISGLAGILTGDEQYPATCVFEDVKEKNSGNKEILESDIVQKSPNSESFETGDSRAEELLVV